MQFEILTEVDFLTVIIALTEIFEFEVLYTPWGSSTHGGYVYQVLGHLGPLGLGWAHFRNQ